MPQILVIAEHDRRTLRPASASAAAFAQRFCSLTEGAYEVLVLGSDVAGIAAGAAHWGAAAVLVADAPALAMPLADRYAHVIAQVARDRGAGVVVAASSTFSKDVLPRAAGLLDAGMLSDVVDLAADAEGIFFRRAMYAGNAVASVRLEGAVRVLTVRAGAFAAPVVQGAGSPIITVEVDPAALPAATEFVGCEPKMGSRPDPTEARIVVSGGRAMRTAEDFERLVGGLADALGAAIGSSRALVDSGITHNTLQIGQTGKIVAPELYIALGISGAIQHLAGIKDSKVIVAINKDGDAPIFEVADYGLVADVYTVVPEMIAKLKS